ncbi:hypothetical protein FQN54_008656 [Arachnomyces sp. PD_36]|nr:hypothetical protein FQN54_008656 [Arachnomyces sp. PD_36]
MPPANLSHRRTHNLLLISKLLSLRDNVSPLTLVLDSLEQPATPLIREYIRRAKLSKVDVTFVSFETLNRPDGVDNFIKARRKNPSQVAKEIAATTPPSSSTAPQIGPGRRRLIIIDSIHPLICGTGSDAVHLPAYLSSLLAPSDPTQAMQTSLIVTYHNDIPPPANSAPYTPTPRSLLTYLATSIISVHPLSHILAEKAARDRSEIAPVFGLAEVVEGVLIGRPTHQGKNDENSNGIVLEMEHRRKSGRGIVEWYYLPAAKRNGPPQLKETAILLDDHPLYRREDELDQGENEEPDSTFNLGLTERQRQEREGVVLPYFDAQKGGGPGEGGRILYDMGEEDDFDEEEDEI